MKILGFTVSNTVLMLKLQESTDDSPRSCSPDKILQNVYDGSNSANNLQPALSWRVRVAKLLDSYLAEVARDSKLPLAKFQSLAEALPEGSRLCDDGLYRAVDTYLKVCDLRLGHSISDHVDALCIVNLLTVYNYSYHLMWWFADTSLVVRAREEAPVPDPQLPSPLSRSLHTRFPERALAAPLCCAGSLL